MAYIGPKYTMVEDFSPGFNAKRDITQLPAGALVVGSKNVGITDGDRVGVRPGSTLFSPAASGTSKVNNMITVAANDTDYDVLVRAYGGSAYYLHPVTGTWENLVTGYSSSLPLGFGWITNSGNVSSLCMCDGQNTYRTWNPAITYLTSATTSGDTTINVNSVFTQAIFYSGTAIASTATTVTIANPDWDTGLWADNYYIEITSGAQSGKIALISTNQADTTKTTTIFASITGLTGTFTFRIRKLLFATSTTVTSSSVIGSNYLRIGTSSVSYTGITATSFTGCSGVPTAAVNSGVTIDTVPVPLAVRGHIFAKGHGQLYNAGAKQYPFSLFSSGILLGSTWGFTVSTTGETNIYNAGQAGKLTFLNGTGPITALSNIEDTTIIFKKDFIGTYNVNPSWGINSVDQTLAQATRVPLAESPNCGATNFKGVCKVDNSVAIATPEHSIKLITRVANINSLQVTQLSDPIKTALLDYDFNDAALFFFGQKLYVSCRSLIKNGPANDTVFVYNFQKGAWEPPIEGWYVSCWAVYNGELYFGSSLNEEIYKVEVPTTTNAPTYSDNGVGYEAVARFAFTNMGISYTQKQAGTLLMEGLITSSTEITVSALYNYNGAQEVRSAVLNGADDTFVVAYSDYQALATDELGVEPLASLSKSQDELRRFRVYFKTPPQTFYELGVEVSSTEAGSRWEITRFGYDVEIGNIDQHLQKGLT